MSTLPRVVAHRGSSSEFAEHTRSAYRHALAEGADGLECDLRLTRDLVPILMHDSRLDATTSASGPVGDWTAEELDAVTVGPRTTAKARRRRERATELASKQATEWATELAPRQATERTTQLTTQLDMETGVLRLRGFFALAAAAGRPVELALETKHPTRGGRHLEAAVVDALAEQPDLRPAVRIMSFAPGALRRVRALDPRLPTVLLLPDPRAGHRSGVLPPWADAVGPSVRHLRRDPELVARMHDAGHEVHVWTVDDGRDLDRCVALGVDVVISNRPRDLLRRLGR